MSKMLVRMRSLLILYLVTCSGADDIDMDVDNSIMMKALREIADQNKTDTLNLPANASSIRENITDTFSCENRTYGYYADVDNECQVFHVCLPTQAPGGRNVTYRYSFICPNETIFNQEVLTCTRPRDSIPCEDSPEFYHLNMEIGKESNKTEDNESQKENNKEIDKEVSNKEADKQNKKEESNKEPDNEIKNEESNKEVDNLNKKEESNKEAGDLNKKEDRKLPKRKIIKKKENLVVENFIKDIVKDELKEKLEALEFGMKTTDLGENPLLIEAVIENIRNSQTETEREEDLDRIVMERNLRNERQMRRGGFRFKSDAKAYE